MTTASAGRDESIDHERDRASTLASREVQESQYVFPELELAHLFLAHRRTKDENLAISSEIRDP